MDTMIIPAEMIRAALLCVSKDKTRRSLTAIHIYTRGGRLFVEATDSYKLIKIDAKKPVEASDTEVKVVFPYLKTVKKSITTCELKIIDDNTVEMIERNANAETEETISGTILNCNYPSFENLVKDYDECNSIDYEPIAPKMLEVVPKIAKALNSETCEIIGQSGTGVCKPLLFECENDSVKATIVIMPVACGYRMRKPMPRHASR